MVWPCNLNDHVYYLVIVKIKLHYEVSYNPE